MMESGRRILAQPVRKLLVGGDSCRQSRRIRIRSGWASAFSSDGVASCVSNPLIIGQKCNRFDYWASDWETTNHSEQPLVRNVRLLITASGFSNLADGVFSNTPVDRPRHHP